MKKPLFIPLTLLVGTLSLGYLSQHNVYHPLKADSFITYIEMNADAFSDYSEDKGSFAEANATFWDEGYSFNALTSFFRGETKETWTGELSLKPWKQYSQYIRFQWGGANPEDALMKLEIHYGEYTYTMVNDTFAENPMLMNYFKIPDEQYALLDKDNGFDMYIKFIDGRNAGYGFHNFGALYVNQNLEEVSNAMRYYLNHINVSDTRDWKLNNNKTIYNFYLNNDHLKEAFLKTTNNVDEDFEDINNFLNHWYLDINYGNNATDERHTDNLLSNRAVRDGSNMPFNKTDASFFSGWHEALINQGYIASDYPIYRFVSRPFVLSGTGLVSIKMAGRSASLHVIDTETQTDLAWADLRTFSNSGDENRQYTGFNTVTMVRHYINLSAYLGKTIQLAIADVYQDNWAASYFDELITNYETYPSFDIDVTFQDNNEDKTYAYYFDQYIAATHIDNDTNGLKYRLGKDDVTIIDESPIYEAYKFLKSYYASLRSEATEFKYEKATQTVRKEIYDAYVALSSAAKEIVNNSSDLQFNQEFDDTWHKKMMNTNTKIGSAFSTIIDEFITYTVGFSANGGTGTMDSVDDIKGEYPLPTCKFTAPEGQEFVGWKVNNEGDLLEAGETIIVNANTTLVAYWKDLPVTTYTVSFNANGGSGTMADIPNQYGDFPLPDNDFTAPGEKYFIGWKINNEGDLLQPKESITLTADITLYAQWQATIYTVSFDPNGGTGTMDNVEVEKGQKLLLPQCKFTAPEGKEFAGWILRNEVYDVGEEVDIIADTVIYAKWKLIPVIEETYTVSFSANGGTGTMDDVTDVSGEYTLPSCGFIAPEGQEFAGWLVDNKMYQPGQSVIVDADTTIIASWQDKEVVPPSPSSSEPDSSRPDENSSSSVSPDSSEGQSEEPVNKKGCGGEVLSSIVVSSSALLLGIVLTAIKRRKEEEK